MTLSLVIQILLILHVVKTGRNIYWLFIIALLPVAGSIVYFIVEIVPDIIGSQTGRQVSQKITEVLNPNKNLNQAAAADSVNDSIDNTKKLADECLNKQMYIEAKQLYKQCLSGLYEYDPDLMYGLAESEYGLANYAEVEYLLHKLITHNPCYKNQKTHLLFAKTLEHLGKTDSAIEEYEVLNSYYTSPEPTYYLAKLLKRQGQKQKATELFKKIILQSKVSGRHYYSLHKTWIKLAKNEL